MAYESDTLVEDAKVVGDATAHNGAGPAEAQDDSLKAAAQALNARLNGASPQAILAEALGLHAGRIALVSSFGAESAVLLHMVAAIDPSTPILFLDTGQLFGQTLDYRKVLAKSLGLRDVRDLRPAYADLATLDPKADLWRRDTEVCCHIRKVAPLDLALSGFDAWITGRKRFQSQTRAHLPIVEANPGLEARGLQGKGRLKFNPLAAWGKAELDAYGAAHALPAHPLTAFGYPSVGCWPCTKPVETGQDLRSGRWAGSEKTECGIHTPRSGALDQDVGGGI
jgi:phosphoadenosine phosphosulfate reductase